MKIAGLGQEIEIRIRRQAVGAQSDPYTALEQLLDGMKPMAEGGVGPRTLDDRSGLRYRRDRIEIVGMHAQATCRAGAHLQNVGDGRRQSLGGPYSQFLEETHKRAAVLCQELQFVTRLGQMRGQQKTMP